jgi:hypothetical protein
MTAKLFLDHVFQYHSLLKYIIFDHGLQFASKFWKKLFELLGMKLKLSSTFHPQTNGQTKWVNQNLEQYLNCTTNYHQDNWLDLLSMAKIAYNNIVHYSIQQTHLFANHGLHPKWVQMG